MMTHHQEKIIPTRWPGGAVIGITENRKLSAMANLLAKTRLRMKWSHELSMVVFVRKT